MIEFSTVAKIDPGKLDAFNEMMHGINETMSNIQYLNSHSSFYELVVSNFCEEEDKVYRQLANGLGKHLFWNITQNEVKNFLNSLIYERGVVFILLPVMKFFTQWLLDQEQIHKEEVLPAYTLHIDTYYKTLYDLEHWIRAGLDWYLCWLGEYFDIHEFQYIQPASTWLDIVMLGKLACYREECVIVSIPDLREHYIYIPPIADFENPISFSSLVLDRDRNPFGQVSVPLYPERIPLTDVYESAATAFGVETGVFSSMLQRRPYVFLFIVALLVDEGIPNFLAITDQFDKDYLKDHGLPNMAQKLKIIDDILKHHFPIIYSLLPCCNPPTKWYFRALGVFKEEEIKNNVKIISFYPWVNIVNKYEILLDWNLVAPL
jgi:hypothetical protein